MILENICKELGIEFNEEWYAEGGGMYRLTDDGELEHRCILITLEGENIHGWCQSSSKDYSRLIAGDLKKKEL